MSDIEKEAIGMCIMCLENIPKDKILRSISKKAIKHGLDKYEFCGRKCFQEGTILMSVYCYKKENPEFKSPEFTDEDLKDFETLVRNRHKLQKR